jgi:plasmid stabilization system protein ParE
MPYSIVTTTNSRKDIQDAINWENMRSPGLAKRFLADLEQKLDVISKNPHAFNIRCQNIRCIPTDIFQYLIHYIIDDNLNQVIILRVLHTSRKPFF